MKSTYDKYDYYDTRQSFMMTLEKGDRFMISYEPKIIKYLYFLKLLYFEKCDYLGLLIKNIFKMILQNHISSYDMKIFHLLLLSFKVSLCIE